MSEEYADLPIKALSIRQPWAWAIVHAGKDIENRSWRTGNPGLSFRGPVAIHASGGMTRDEYEETAEWFERIGVSCPPPRDLIRGGIIGVAIVEDIVTHSDSKWFFGSKGLVLSGAAPVDFIPCSGALGFFDWRKGVHDRGPLLPAKWMDQKSESESKPKQVQKQREIETGLLL